jgi:hypothetical protein
MCKNSVKKRVSESLMRREKRTSDGGKKLTNWLGKRVKREGKKTSKAKCRQEIHLQVMKLL